ncbi:MAG: hypothetical protein JSV27_02460 [Candidatus Bathyarchaeota archaeon]|nr:MAG: hypothetical protein JSV27_02460 [Candidatus Bathyarchaeota archaeon]
MEPASGGAVGGVVAGIMESQGEPVHAEGEDSWVLIELLLVDLVVHESADQAETAGAR